jgi:cell division protein FtsW (lipid II flippase)
VAKRAVVTIVKVVAFFAGIVVLLMPLHLLRDDVGIFLFTGSVAILIICYFVWRALNEKSAGYWPVKQSRRPGNSKREPPR